MSPTFSLPEIGITQQIEEGKVVFDHNGQIFYLDSLTAAGFLEHFPDIDLRKEIKSGRLKITVDGKELTYKEAVEHYAQEVMDVLTGYMKTCEDIELLAGITKKFTSDVYGSANIKSEQGRSTWVGKRLEMSLFGQSGGSEARPDIGITKGKFAQFFYGVENTLGLEQKATRGFSKVIAAGEMTLRLMMPRTTLDILLTKNTDLDHAIRSGFNLTEYKKEALVLFEALSKLKDIIFIRFKDEVSGDLLNVVEVTLDRIEVFLLLKIDLLYDDFVKRFPTDTTMTAVAKGIKTGLSSLEHVSDSSKITKTVTTEEGREDVILQTTVKAKILTQDSVVFKGEKDPTTVREMYETDRILWDAKSRGTEVNAPNVSQSIMAGIMSGEVKYTPYPLGPETPFSDFYKSQEPE